MSSSNKRKVTPKPTPEKMKVGTRLHAEHLKKRRLSYIHKDAQGNPLAVDASVKERIDRANNPTYYYKKDVMKWQKEFNNNMMKEFRVNFTQKFGKPIREDVKMMKLILQGVRNNEDNVLNKGKVLAYRKTENRKKKALFTYIWLHEHWVTFKETMANHRAKIKEFKEDDTFNTGTTNEVELLQKIADSKGGDVVRTDEGELRKMPSSSIKSPVPFVDIDKDWDDISTSKFDKAMFDRLGGRRKKKYTKRKGRRRRTKKKRKKRNSKKRTRRRRRKRRR